MNSTKFIAPSITIFCSQDPTDNFSSNDISTNSLCVCPPNQTQVFKQIGEQKFFKCELNSKISNNNKGSDDNGVTCSKTPDTINPKDWNGLSTDEKCICPDVSIQTKTNINDNTYYTCS
jgi:hypothetical protein